MGDVYSVTDSLRLEQQFLRTFTLDPVSGNEGQIEVFKHTVSSSIHGFDLYRYFDIRVLLVYGYLTYIDLRYKGHLI
jgi:hypothetical protein